MKPKGLVNKWGPRRFALVALGLTLTFSVANDYRPYSFLFADGTFYANVNRSLAETWSFRQNHYTAHSWYFEDLSWNRDLPQDWSNVALGADDTSLYPKHPVLMPIVAHPLFLMFGFNGLLLFNLAALLVCAWLVAWLVDPDDRRPWAAAALLLTFVAPTVFRWAAAFSNDVFAGALAAGAIVAVKTKRAGLAGALMAGTVWTRPIHLIVVVIGCAPVLGSWLRSRRDLLLRAVAGGTPVGLAWLGLNMAWFGSPFVTGYDRIVVRHAGVIGLDSAAAAFDVPFLSGLHKILFDHTQGFAAGFPALALVPLGWLALARRRAWGETAASVAALGGAVVAYAPYRWPNARFLFPFLPFIVGPVATLLEEIARTSSSGWTWLTLRASSGWRRGLAVCTLVAIATLVLRGGLALMFKPDAIEIPVIRVSANEGVIPCDFWNLKWHRWECSHLDRDERDMAGAPAAEECRFPGVGWVRFPVAGPWADKTMELLPPQGARAMRLWTVRDQAVGFPQGVRVVVGGLGAKNPVVVLPDSDPALASTALSSGTSPIWIRVDSVNSPSRPDAAICLRWEWINNQENEGADRP